MKAISIRQPWALAADPRDKGHRESKLADQHRGTIAIHAAKGMTREEYEDAREFVESFDLGLAKDMPDMPDLVRGAIIGTMELRDCVHSSDSPWFQGPYGFKLDTPQPCDPIEAKGALGFWDWFPQTTTDGATEHTGSNAGDKGRAEGL